MADAGKSTTLKMIVGAAVLMVTIAAVVMARPQQHHTRHHHGSEGGGGGGGGQERGRRDPFLVHLARVQSFLCREARPRSIGISDLLNEAGEDSYRPDMGEVAFPPVTVLHRCDKFGGCCLQGEKFTCSAVDMERVALVFQVSRVITQGAEEGSERSWLQRRQETIYATNHTRCACIEEADMPK